MQINLTFRNPEQALYYWSRARNNQFDGAFGNGKTYVGCERAFTLLSTFGNYAYSICRQEYKRLRTTTMKTFFKICPDAMIHRHDEQSGITVLKNRSFIYWMHLDDYDEQDLRGLEINSCLIDQAEEINEGVYLIVDARVGRWDKAVVPVWLLRSQLSPEDFEVSKRVERNTPKLLEDFITKQTLWPRHPKWGQFLVPNYMDVLCNIAQDDEFHWTYRRYNPESYERQPGHFYVTAEMDASLTDERTYNQLLLRDEEWVQKYVKGIRSGSRAAIHQINEMSIIDPDKYTKEEFEEFLKILLSRGSLERILDHGETGVSTCGWLATLNSQFIFYREYYISKTLISVNRQNITDLSFDEEYSNDWADPQIFKKTTQVSGIKSGFWTVAEEYAETDVITTPPISWSPADNNELATRNRINELLQLSPKFMHPITKISPAPGLYFIKKSSKSYPYGCEQAILQTKAQRRTLLGSDNGKNIYSEERDENITDHAYDWVRYGIAMHSDNKSILRKLPPRKSFAYFNALLKKRPHFVPASY